MENLNFIPNEREIRLNPDQSILFKFSKEYKLEYVNDFFTEFTGYEIHDVIGNGVETLNHSDIPEVVTNMVNESVKNKKNINIILKNTTKDGRYYWFLTDFVFKTDANNDLVSFNYYRRFPSKYAIPTLEKLYKKLVDIEKHASIKVAKKYLYGFLEEKNMTFQDYIESISQGDDFNSLINQIEKPKKKKSWFRR